MSDNDQPTFDSQDAGSALTFPKEAGQIRKGEHQMLKGFPCKVGEISVSKTGKHGHQKCRMVGIDIFTGKKVEDMCPSGHTMAVPFVDRKEYTVMDVDVDQGTISLLTEGGEPKDDVNLPNQTEDDEKLVGNLSSKFEEGKSLMVTVLNQMGKEKIIDLKEI